MQFFGIIIFAWFNAYLRESVGSGFTSIVCPSVSTNNNIHDFVTSKDGYYVDETLKDSFSGASTFTATNNLYIYANEK